MGRERHKFACAVFFVASAPTLGISTQVEIASEYRYRESVPNSRSLVVVISQYGETAGTLAALEQGQSLGHEHTLASCNVVTSVMALCAFTDYFGLSVRR